MAVPARAERAAIGQTGGRGNATVTRIPAGIYRRETLPVQESPERQPAQG
jgi:hypothetical protein